MVKLSYNEKFLKKYIKEYGVIEHITNHNLFDNLSEDFVREYRDYLDWYNVSLMQPLNNNFIREFRKYLDWTVVIMERNDISWDYRNAWAKELNLKNLINNSLLKWYYDGD